MRPDWREIALAYEEAAEHLDRCAAESDDQADKTAQKIVASRIRAAGNRVRPVRR